MTFNVKSPKRDTALVVQLSNNNWVTIFEILFELENLSDNELSGVLIYTIPTLNGSNTDQDSNKSDNEHEENRMCCFCKNVYCYGKHNKRLS